jgi:hypothetical protein
MVFGLWLLPTSSLASETLISGALERERSERPREVRAERGPCWPAVMGRSGANGESGRRHTLPIRIKRLVRAKRYTVEAQGQRFDIWEPIYYTDDLDGTKRYADAMLES